MVPKQNTRQVATELVPRQATSQVPTTFQPDLLILWQPSSPKSLMHKKRIVHYQLPGIFTNFGNDSSKSIPLYISLFLALRITQQKAPKSILIPDCIKLIRHCNTKSNTKIRLPMPSSHVHHVILTLLCWLGTASKQWTLKFGFPRPLLHAHDLFNSCYVSLTR